MRGGELWRQVKTALFPSVPPSAEAERVRRADAARALASLQCRGNVSVQAGRMLSDSNVDALRQEVLSHRFR